MSTLTRICTRPIFKVEIDLTFELNEEKVVILEEDLLYKVKYIVPINHGDSISPIREFVGRLAKIIPTSEKGFNPFYNGNVYNLIFDISEEYNSIEVKLSTAQIRDINLYTNNDQEDEENNENEDTGNDETGNENSGELDPDGTGSGNDESQSGDGSEDQGSAGGNVGNDESDGNGDSQPTEPGVDEDITESEEQNPINPEDKPGEEKIEEETPTE